MDGDRRHSSNTEDAGLRSYEGATLNEMEAAEASTILASQFPNSAKADPAFLHSLAQLLRAFPRSIAEDCINPAKGYATDCEFISIYGVNKWCLERAERFWQAQEREKRIRRQLAERDERPARTEKGLAAARAWLDRTDPRAQQLSGEIPKSTQVENASAGQRLTYAEFLGLKTNRPPIGRFPSKFDPVDKGRNRPSPDQANLARDKLVAEFGQQAFNAVPDQPLTFRKLG